MNSRFTQKHAVNCQHYVIVAKNGVRLFVKGLGCQSLCIRKIQTPFFDILSAKKCRSIWLICVAIGKRRYSSFDDSLRNFLVADWENWNSKRT